MINKALNNKKIGIRKHDIDKEGDEIIITLSNIQDGQKVHRTSLTENEGFE